MLQQVPPTQWPFWQSTSWVQLAPSSRGPHDPATHITPDTQPAPSWQLGLQRGAPSTTLQANGAQGTAGPATQLPAPSQDDPAVMLGPEQTPWPQRTPAGYLRQAPRPSQVPSEPQLSGGCTPQPSSSLPSGVFEQVPSLPAMLHARHRPLHELTQQTPSTQKLLRHWLSAVQMAPLGRSVPLTMGPSAPPSPLPPKSTTTTGTSCFTTIAERAARASTTSPGPSALTSQRTNRPA